MALGPPRPVGKRSMQRSSRASELDVRCVVHGGDFTFTGCDPALDVAERLMNEKFMCKVEGRLG
eukprot:12364863-Alexandrium_andersonii.AAC.1